MFSICFGKNEKYENPANKIKQGVGGSAPGLVWSIDFLAVYTGSQKQKKEVLELLVSKFWFSSGCVFGFTGFRKLREACRNNFHLIS